MGSSFSLCSSYCNKFISSVVMESHYFNSVVSLVDSAVSPSPPVRAPSLAPVFRPSLTDFSISRILGLENDVTHQDSTCTGESNFSTNTAYTSLIKSFCCSTVILSYLINTKTYCNMPILSNRGH